MNQLQAIKLLFKVHSFGFAIHIVLQIQNYNLWTAALKLGATYCKEYSKPSIWRASPIDGQYLGWLW